MMMLCTNFPIEVYYQEGWMCECGQSLDEHEIKDSKLLCFVDEDFPDQEYFPIINNTTLTIQ